MIEQKKYKVYQIPVDTEESSEARNLRLDTTMGWEFLNKRSGYAAAIPAYRHVATITAEDTEHAFRLMNLWEEPQRIERIEGERTHSMSVGDILVDEERGQHFFCDRFGFQDITEEHKRLTENDDLGFQEPLDGSVPPSP